MNFLKTTFVAAALAMLSLSSPASATSSGGVTYSDDVVIAAIDQRVEMFNAQLHALQIEYRNATSNSDMKRIKREYIGVLARKLHLLRVRHYVKKLPDLKNTYIVTHYNLNIASPSS